jgi:hypothetical protein
VAKELSLEPIVFKCNELLYSLTVGVKPEVMMLCKVLSNWHEYVIDGRDVRECEEDELYADVIYEVGDGEEMIRYYENSNGEYVIFCTTDYVAFPKGEKVYLDTPLEEHIKAKYPYLEDADIAGVMQTMEQMNHDNRVFYHERNEETALWAREKVDNLRDVMMEHGLEMSDDEYELAFKTMYMKRLEEKENHE